MGIAAAKVVATRLGRVLQVEWESPLIAEYLGGSFVGTADQSTVIPLFGPELGHAKALFGPGRQAALWPAVVTISTYLPVHYFFGRHDYAASTREAFSNMFDGSCLRFSKEVNQAAEEAFNGVDPGTMIGLQVRCGDAGMGISDGVWWIPQCEFEGACSALLKFLAQIGNPSVYLTSDSSQFVELFRGKYDTKKVRQVDGTVVHVGSDVSTTSRVKTLADHAALSKCKVVVGCPWSGFGWTAAACGGHGEHFQLNRDGAGNYSVCREINFLSDPVMAARYDMDASLAAGDPRPQCIVPRNAGASRSGTIWNTAKSSRRDVE